MDKENETQYMQFLFQDNASQAYEACLEKIKSCRPEERKTHKALLCHILNSLQRYEESDQILEAIYRETPEDFRILHNWAAVKRMRGDYQTALKMFEKESTMIADNSDPLCIATNAYELAKTNHMLGNIEEALLLANRCFYYSEKCDDPIMHGCSYRILGDLYYNYSTELCLVFYEIAKLRFSKGMDPRAINDIDERIRSVNAGKDPKSIS